MNPDNPIPQSLKYVRAIKEASLKWLESNGFVIDGIELYKIDIMGVWFFDSRNKKIRVTFQDIG